MQLQISGDLPNVMTHNELLVAPGVLFLADFEA